MGTPDISVKPLVALAKRYDVIGLFCGEDKPQGRKQIITPPETKVAANALGIDVYQPKNLRSHNTISLVNQLNPELIVTMAYGKLLPKALLEIPKYGAINAHASLLPAYRGASPIQHAIMNREQKTGVSIMKLDEGLDTGDIILQKEINLSEECDASELFSIVSDIATNLLLDTVEMLTNNTVEYIKQDASKATYAPIITKDMGEFSFSADANRIVSLVKGLSIWPQAFFMYDDKKIKVLKASFSSETAEVGQIISLKPLTIAAINGSVIVHEVMPQSKGRMTGTAYIVGLRLAKGDFLR